MQRSGQLASTSITSSRSPVGASSYKYLPGRISDFLPLTRHFGRIWRRSFVLVVTKLHTSPARDALAHASPPSVPSDDGGRGCHILLKGAALISCCSQQATLPDAIWPVHEAAGGLSSSRSACVIFSNMSWKQDFRNITNVQEI